MIAATGERNSWPTKAASACCARFDGASPPGFASGMGVSSSGATGSPARQRLDLCQEARQIDRLGVVIVAARREGTITIAGHRMSRQADHRNRLGGGVAFEPPGRLPAVDPWQAHVHQNEVRLLILCRGDAG